jgi:L-threonylcarbamoyladenylate synthase
VKVVPQTAENIRLAAEALRRGELIGMPTETVYGLAGVASNPEAIRRIYEAKGRPSENPLIVHVSSVPQVATVAREIPDLAIALGEAFWPGPLTLVLPKRGSIPDEVTGGRDTVAVRVPDHSVAIALIEAADRPLAAPSANTFMRLSPTRAQDLEPAILDSTAMVLDAGPTRIGIESTVVVVLPEVRILRPGSISRAEIEQVLGMSIEVGGNDHASPGQYARHYAPATPLKLVDQLGELPGLGFFTKTAEQIAMPLNPRAYAVALYSTLKEMDRRGLEAIYVERPPTTGEWEAVWDRLRKASS